MLGKAKQKKNRRTTSHEFSFFVFSSIFIPIHYFVFFSQHSRPIFCSWFLFEFVSSLILEIKLEIATNNKKFPYTCHQQQLYTDELHSNTILDSCFFSFAYYNHFIICNMVGCLHFYYILTFFSFFHKSLFFVIVFISFCLSRINFSAQFTYLLQFTSFHCFTHHIICLSTFLFCVCICCFVECVSHNLLAYYEMFGEKKTVDCFLTNYS